MNSLIKITNALILLLFLVGCDSLKLDAVTEPEKNSEDKGYLVIAGMNLTVSSTGVNNDNIEGEVTRASTTKTSDAPDNYIVKISNSLTGEIIENTTYGETKAQSGGYIALSPGTYKIESLSPDDIQDAAWDKPEYYGSIDKAIRKKDTITVNDLVCELANIKTTVELSADLVNLFKPDGAEAADNFKVTLSLNSHQLEYSRDEDRAGFFKAQDTLNTIDVKLSGQYNNGSSDVPNYIPMNWKQQIKNVKAGEWRKVLIKIEHASDGNVSFIVQVETWTYDEEIDVNTMSVSYQYSEEEILDPDLEVTEPDSPIVTLGGGHNISDPYHINSNSFDFEGMSRDKIQSTIKPTPNSTVVSLDIVIDSDNSDLLAALTTAGYADNRIAIYPTNQVSDKVRTNTSGENLLVNVTNVGMTDLFRYSGTHTMKIIVKDSENRRSFTDMTIIVDNSGGIAGGPTIEWEGDYDFNVRHDIAPPPSPSLPVVIEVASTSGITGFEVHINSVTLTEGELGGLDLATEMNLINPATPEMAKALSDILGFPIRDEVSGKRSLSFDITKFMPMLAALGLGHTDFVFIVTDASGSNTKTLMLNAIAGQE